VDGVERCGGAGRWQDIKRLEYRALARRSAVDLKDKCGFGARVPPTTRSAVLQTSICIRQASEHASLSPVPSTLQPPGGSYSLRQSMPCPAATQAPDT